MSVGIRLAFEWWAAERYFVENERQEGSVPADLLCRHDGAVIVKNSLGAWFTVGPRSRSQRAAARFLGVGFLDVESVEQCIEAVKGYGLVAQWTE